MEWCVLSAANRRRRTANIEQHLHVDFWTETGQEMYLVIKSRLDVGQSVRSKSPETDDAKV